MHAGTRGAIVAAPDLDVDGDGLRDPAFLSVQREGSGAAVATVTVAFGAPRGFARVETHALDVPAALLNIGRWPFLARLHPRQDALVLGSRLYVVDGMGMGLVLALEPTRHDAGNATWTARLLAEERGPHFLPSGDLDGDGTATSSCSRTTTADRSASCPRSMASAAVRCAWDSQLSLAGARGRTPRFVHRLETRTAMAPSNSPAR